MEGNRVLKIEKKLVLIFVYGACYLLFQAD
jgi:hypothetical protein